MDIVDIVMSYAKNFDLIIDPHFLIRLKERYGSKVPDESGVYNLMSTIKPVYCKAQSESKYKFFYNINTKYDLIVILSCKKIGIHKIILETIYPQEVKRRGN